jgi:hypothetical protein
MDWSRRGDFLSLVPVLISPGFRHVKEAEKLTTHRNEHHLKVRLKKQKRANYAYLMKAKPFCTPFIGSGSSRLLLA